MKIVFLGSGAFGIPTLRALCAPGSGHEVVGIVTQPDRPAGRDRRLTPTAVAGWAAEHLPSVPVLKPEDVNNPAIVERIRRLGAFEPAPRDHLATDLPPAWVVVAYGQKLSRELLDGIFAVNLHGSLLPRWRGAAPINHAILAGDEATGNSVITIADRMDAGLVLGRSEPPIRIEPWMTAGELHDVLAEDGPGVVLRVLAEREKAGQDWTRMGEPQDESLVTRAGKLSRADGWIDFADGAEACRRRIHGLTPWPGVTVVVDRGTGVPPVNIAHRGPGVPPVTIKLLRVEVADANSQGEIGSIADAAAGIVRCGGGGGKGGALRLLHVQPAGKRAMTWSDFVHGHAVEDGSVLRSEVAPPPDRARAAGRKGEKSC
jgi:methionyl-tRNA formyltransferase